jgi:hypothetical protein
MVSPRSDVAALEAPASTILHGYRNRVVDFTASAQGPAHLSLLTCAADWTSPTYRDPWNEWIQESNNIDVLFQSPDWFDHLVAAEHDKRLALGVAKSDEGHVIGLAPLVSGHYPFRYEVKGRILKHASLPSLFIYGGAPLFPERTDLYDDLFAMIDNAYPEISCICFFSMLKDTFCWRYLQESTHIKQRFLRYSPSGIRSYRAIALPATFAEYLQKFNSKKRYNLGRQLKLLEKVAGPIELQTIQTREQLPAFFDMATHVARQSWKFARRGMTFDSSFEMLADLADRGILRSYLLRAGGKPCAYVLGYQYHDVYYYSEVGYDQDMSAYSPGTGLLYLLIRDLIEQTPLRRLNFDFGDAPYKREFSNVNGEDATVLLMRKTFPNRMRCAIHGAFSSAVQNLKIWLAKRRERRSPPPHAQP